MTNEFSRNRHADQHDDNYTGTTSMMVMRTMMAAFVQPEQCRPLSFHSTPLHSITDTLAHCGN